MKKHFYTRLAFVGLFIFAGLLSSACDGAYTDPEYAGGGGGSIVGTTYKGILLVVETTVTFTSESSFTMTADGKSVVGTYTKSGNTITATGSGGTETWTIEGNTLIIYIEVTGSGKKTPFPLTKV